MDQLPPAVLRKVRKETAAKPDKGFPIMGASHYLEWLQAYHRNVNPQLYFEIGTESGASLAFARGTAIAVDPEFKIQNNVVRQQPELHLFQKTSDAFFEGGFLEIYGKQIDFAFLDGMHQMEFLLRDFMNTEAHMAPGGVIAMHDCVPMSFPAAERDWDKSKTRRWTGDVWKIIPILQTYRPDLTVEVLDLAPSGIVKVTNLDPANRALQNNYEKILEEYVSLSLQDYGLETLTNVLQRVENPTRAVSKPRVIAWESPSRVTDNSLKIAIKTPKARQKNASKIVDFAFARALADGLLSLGHFVRIDPGSEWYRDTEGTDFDLLLRGRGGFEPQPDIPLVMWAIYPGKKERHQITDEELRSVSHCFFASQSMYETFKADGHSNISPLLQGFDPRVMTLPPSDERAGTVFVGSNHFDSGEMRPIIRMALEAKHPVKIWGRGWQATDAEPNLQGTYIENAKVGALYQSAKIVLCDHMDSMRLGGFISNRIFDALACGAAVISDDVAGLPPELEQDVFLCKSSQDFAEAVQKIENEGPAEMAARRDRAQRLYSQFTLFSRAAEISRTLQKLKGRALERPTP